MGMRRQLCGLLFWLKVLVSIGVAVGMYTFFVLKVISMQKESWKPFLDISSNNAECRAERNQFARLDFPDGKFMYGLHIRWQTGHYPVDYENMLNGRKPAIL